MTDLYAQEKPVKKDGNKKKMYALVLVIVILVGALGYVTYTNYGDLFQGVEQVTNADEAASTLSELGNDISGISDDLKGMENIL